MRFLGMEAGLVCLFVSLYLFLRPESLAVLARLLRGLNAEC